MSELNLTAAESKLLLSIFRHLKGDLNVGHPAPHFLLFIR